MQVDLIHSQAERHDGLLTVELETRVTLRTKSGRIHLGQTRGYCKTEGALSSPPEAVHAVPGAYGAGSFRPARQRSTLRRSSCVSRGSAFFDAIGVRHDRSSLGTSDYTSTGSAGTLDLGASRALVFTMSASWAG